MSYARSDLADYATLQIGATILFSFELKMSEDSFSYDLSPYGSRVFPNTSPCRLAAMATLHGLSPASPDGCRMLDLGCGDGTNILSLAYALPESSFLGIDLSDVHIRRANDAVRELGLKNIEFLRADIASVGVHEIGRFDYICAHGLFSWVPPNVRDAILALYSECLSESGVGYVSYNVYPGGHLRAAAWDLMRYHVSGENDPVAQVAASREILKFISEAAPEGPYKEVLREEQVRVNNSEDDRVLHDDLSPHSQPLFFHEFARLLGKHELSYITEADPDLATRYTAATEAIDIIKTLSAGDRIRKEQYLDFLGCRRFRTSLICRSGRNSSDDYDANMAKKLLFTSEITYPDASSFEDDSPVRFTTPEGNSFEIGHPPTKVALRRMSEAEPLALEWETMIEAETGLDEHHCALLLTNLVELFSLKLIDLTAFQPPMASTVSVRPRSSSFARYQIKSGSRKVTALTGSNIEMTLPMVRQLFSLLDGSKDRDQLAEEIILSTGASTVSAAKRAELVEMISGNLEEFRRLGLLEP